MIGCIQTSIAKETLQVFAPLAKLLGMYQIKVFPPAYSSTSNSNNHFVLWIPRNFFTFMLPKDRYIYTEQSSFVFFGIDLPWHFFFYVSFTCEEN